MVGDPRRAQPVAPEIDRGVQRAERLVLAGRDVSAAPGQGYERRLALGKRGAAITAGTDHAQGDAARELKLHIPFFRGDRHGVVPVALVVPSAADAPVIEQRGAVHHGLDPAADARRDPDQGADRAEIRGRPVIVRPSALGLDRADDKSRSWTVIHPVGVCQVVSSTIVPGTYLRFWGTWALLGPNRNKQAARSRSAPKTLGESGRGRHSHSTDPSGATGRLFARNWTGTRSRLSAETGSLIVTSRRQDRISRAVGAGGRRPGRRWPSR